MAKYDVLTSMVIILAVVVIIVAAIARYKRNRRKIWPFLKMLDLSINERFYEESEEYPDGLWIHFPVPRREMRYTSRLIRSAAHYRKVGCTIYSDRDNNRMFFRATPKKGS